MIYLDNNATTPLDPAVFEAMTPFLSTHFGNPSSNNKLGRYARRSLEDARERVAQILGAHPTEISFNSGGTEGDNHALLGSTLFHPDSPSPGTILISQVEHPAIEEPARRAEARGYRINRIPVGPDGCVRISDFESALETAPDIRLVSLMLANNETGAIQPVREVSQLCKERGVPIHTDAVNAVGKMPVRVDNLNIDLLTLSGHKFHAPKGAGILYRRSTCSLGPLMSGGDQEGTLRPGTENVAHATGLAVALENATKNLSGNIERMKRQCQYLLEQIASIHPSVRPSLSPGPALSNTLSLLIPGHSSASLVQKLDQKGIAVSAGAACHAEKTVAPSRILIACGLSETEASQTLRISLSRETTDQELKRAIDGFRSVFLATC